jgi:hypothetical protein
LKPKFNKILTWGQPVAGHEYEIRLANNEKGKPIQNAAQKQPPTATETVD